MKIALLAGGLLGVVLSTWLAPGIIVWWFEPPVEVGYSCREPIAWAMRTFRWTQFVGVAVGAVTGSLVWAMFRPSRTGSADSDPSAP